MVLSYVQLLLVCFAFWSSRHAVARALRGQWDMALPFGGTVLLCLLVAKSEWVILALIDGVLLIAARRIETSRQSKPEPWIESGWGVLCMVTLMLLVLLDVAIFGLVMPLGGLAAWLMAWLPLIALAGGISALFFRDDAMPSTPVLPLRLSRKQCRRIILYEAGLESLPYNQRRSAEHFTQETTRFVHMAGEVLVWKDYGTGDINCTCMYRCSKLDASLFAEKREEVLIKRDFEEFSFDWPWGWSEPGHWEPGTYRVEVFIDEQLVKTGSFTIDPPLPLTEVLFQSTVRFYASRSGYEANQDSVRFPQDTTREIICALTVHNLFYRRREETYHVTAQCYTPEGKILWEDHRDWLIKAGEEEASISWAWQEFGPWKAGAYRQEIQINGEDFAWGAFLIE